ncbi:MAG: hypothetical protein EWM51_03660 [Treponema sp.]|nr:MAG: hypothetical protein EWM51_03660 [Treponema sp.]
MSGKGIQYAKDCAFIAAFFILFYVLALGYCRTSTVAVDGSSEDTEQLERIETLERAAEESGDRIDDRLAEYARISNEREGTIRTIEADVGRSEERVRGIGELSQRSLELITETEDIIRRAIEEGEVQD